MTPKQLAYAKIQDLVTRFTAQYASYKSADYNETQTRRDFIDPFFKALGWDIDNEQGYSEAYREVIHEDRIKIAGHNKAPDYSFKLVGGKRLFFVEAKKPSVIIKDDMAPAYQVRRYGWSAKMQISIITDFEEFAIYDCTTKPKPTDKASNGRIKYITYLQYATEFDFLWDTFAKENILRGSFDKYLQTTSTNKKGTTTVDYEFLHSLDEWRTYLATSIATKNKQLTEDELNFIVQHTLDRLIFLRIAEDRSVEPYANLQATTKSGDYYQNLLQLFHTADQKYNSGLFDFAKDTISNTISIDNKTLKTIINDLYYPISPYEFSVLSVEILGSAYEQFLGKQITLSKSGKAIIEQKPEVRKAGGVYYTPQYIVEYIVANTIGKLVHGKKPADITKLKIIDPACGSGSFLIGAFNYLLNWHKDFYSNNGKPSKGNKDNPLTPDGYLTTAEKKRILLNNIFGVDLDANAVEVTKLSLLLKCMEGETEASINTQQKLFHDRILPTLDGNIKSGNSLIEVDYYNSQMDFGEDRKVKPFSWKRNFEDVFKQGGFDVVIGNPPYLKLTVNNEKKEILDYYNLIYKSYSGGSSKNLFQLFLEKTIQLKPKLFSFIIPEAILTSDSNGKIRNMLLEYFNINAIVTFDHFVFQDATIGTTIIVGDTQNNDETSLYKMNKFQDLIFNQKTTLISNDIWAVEIDDESNLICEKIIENSIPMSDYVSMSKGMVVKNRNDVLTDSPTANSLPFLIGNCMRRYFYKEKKFAEYDNLDIIGGTRDFKKQTSTPKLIIRRTGGILCATYSDKPELVESTLYILRSEKLNLHYLLGLINSKLLTYFLIKKLLTNQQGFPQVLMGQLDQLPIRYNNEFEKEIINNVKLILKLNDDLQTVTLPNQKQQLQDRIEFAENKINELVYGLYELTNEEIKIIEN